MKQNLMKKIALSLTVVMVLAATLTGCGQPSGEVSTPAPESSSTISGESVDGATGSQNTPNPEEEPVLPPSTTPEGTDDAGVEDDTPVPEQDTSTPTPTPDNSQNSSSGSTSLSGTTLQVRFGDDGDPFTMHLYDNNTADKIAEYVGTADWRLPINNYEGYDNWEVMQYYDIPSRYDIPSNPQRVTSEAAGAVYYSDPNRIVLFFGDAEVSSEYTPIGYITYSQDFVDAVKNNPVLEGWGNKIVNIGD